MSQLLPSASEQAFVEAAIRSEDVTRMRPVLLVGDRDLSFAFEEGEWGQGADEFPITMLATLGVVIPRRLEGAPVELYSDVEGVLVPQMFAPYSEFEVLEGLDSCELLAGTAGFLLESITLDERVEYDGWFPDSVVRDAIRRNRHYDQSLVFVEPVERPLLTFTLGDGVDEGFQPFETIADILSRVTETGDERVERQAPYVFRDTARNGFVAGIRSGRAGALSHSRRYDWRDMPNWRPPRRSSIQPSEVCVYRLLADGSIDYAQKVTVEYRGVGYPPLSGVTQWIPFSDNSGLAPERAAQRAYEEAELLAFGLYASEEEQELPSHDALIEKGDEFSVLEVHRDDEGSWDREWLCEVVAFKHAHTQQSASASASASASGTSAGAVTLVDYEAVLLNEEKIAAPAFISPGYSEGVVTTPGVVLGIDASGLWIERVLATNSAGVAWAGIDANGLWIDPALSEGLAGIDASGLWLDASLA